jgi:hypothetical protein
MADMNDPNARQIRQYTDSLANKDTRAKFVAYYENQLQNKTAAADTDGYDMALIHTKYDSLIDTYGHLHPFAAHSKGETQPYYGGPNAGGETHEDHVERIFKRFQQLMHEEDPDHILSSQTKKAFFWSDYVLDGLCCSYCFSGARVYEDGGVQHRHFVGGWWPRIKLGVGVTTCLLYFFSVLWLMFGLQSLSLCRVDDGSNFKTSIVDTATNKSARCSVLLDECKAPFISDLPMMEYYVFRIAVYFLSLIPFIFLVWGAESVTTHFISMLFSEMGDDKAGLPTTRIGADSQDVTDEQRMGAGGYFRSGLVNADPRAFDTDSFVVASAMAMLFTHVILGGITIAADIMVIMYFNGLDDSAKKFKGCPSSPSEAWSFNPQTTDANERACACRALFSGGGEHLVRLSGAQLMTPLQVAWALLPTNIVYTLFGMGFIYRAWAHKTRRDMLHKQNGNLYHALKRAEKKKIAGAALLPAHVAGQSSVPPLAHGAFHAGISPLQAPGQLPEPVIAYRA